MLKAIKLFAFALLASHLVGLKFSYAQKQNCQKAQVLFAAVRTGNTVEVEQLLQKPDWQPSSFFSSMFSRPINIQCGHNNALHIAARQADNKMLNFLIEKGASDASGTP